MRTEPINGICQYVRGSDFGWQAEARAVECKHCGHSTLKVAHTAEDLGTVIGYSRIRAASRAVFQQVAAGQALGMRHGNPGEKKRGEHHEERSLTAPALALFE